MGDLLSLPLGMRWSRVVNKGSYKEDDKRRSRRERKRNGGVTSFGVIRWAGKHVKWCPYTGLQERLVHGLHAYMCTHHTGLPNDESTILTYIVGGLLSYACAKLEDGSPRFEPHVYAMVHTYETPPFVINKIQVPICTKKNPPPKKINHQESPSNNQRWDRFLKLSERRRLLFFCRLKQPYKP